MPEKKDIKDQIRTVIGNPIVSVSANVEEKYIITTEDKVKILYNEYNSAKTLSSNTLSWFGIFIALLIADFTCDFKSFWIFDSSTIKAIFYISTVVFLGLSIKSAIIYIRNKDKLSFKFFLNEITGNSTECQNNNVEKTKE